jgi:hypothetical protein
VKKYLTAIILGLSIEVSYGAQEVNKTIFCTNNLDGTGECYSEKDNVPIKCLAIPGQVIRCKESSGIEYLCVQFEGQFFSCNKINNEDQKANTITTGNSARDNNNLRTQENANSEKQKKNPTITLDPSEW